MYKNYGMTVNGSMVRNNGVYDIGFNVENSDGIKASSSASGNSFYDVISEVYNSILDELEEKTYEKADELEENAQIAELNEKIADLEEKVLELENDVKYYQDTNLDLELDNKLLQKRIEKFSAAAQEAKKVSETVERVNNKAKDSLNEYKKALSDAKTVNEVYSALQKYLKK